MREAQQRPEQVQRLHVSVFELHFHLTVNQHYHMMSHMKLPLEYLEPAD